MATSSTLYDVVWRRLSALNGIDTYDGEVPADPPTDPDGRVRKYAVLFATGAVLSASRFDGEQECLLANYQVTCVGGDQRRALLCVDVVRAGLSGAVTVDGVRRVIRVREEDPGPVRSDAAAWPPRHYVPLEFQLFAP